MTGAPGSPDESRPDVQPEVEAGRADGAAPIDEPTGDPVPPVDGGDPEVDLQVELESAQVALGERTADLQRLQADYINYKRRVERDRDLIRENATYAALAPITEVLDTIDRARESAYKSEQPLDGGFKSVADQLERIVSGLGLTKFGAAGDAFDPTIHEALSHTGQDPDIEVTTCTVIAKAGYRIGDRVVRAAQVLVADPASAG